MEVGGNEERVFEGPMRECERTEILRRARCVDPSMGPGAGTEHLGECGVVKEMLLVEELWSGSAQTEYNSLDEELPTYILLEDMNPQSAIVSKSMPPSKISNGRL